MPTQPIEHAEYNYTQTRSRKSSGDVHFSLGAEESNNRRPEEMPESSAYDLLAATVADVKDANGGELSFSRLSAYLDLMEARWDRSVRADLFSMDVDLSTDFRLVYDPAAGTVVASSDHPDQRRIDQYFMSNREQVEAFKQRLVLDKMVDAAKRSVPEDAIDTPISIEEMIDWFRFNMDTASLFSGGGIVFGKGRSVYRGLDMRV